MKKLFTSILSLTVLSATAQITLNQQSFSATYVGTDTTKRMMAGQTYPSIAPATNASWNFSALNYTNTSFVYNRMAVSNSAFPGGTQAADMFYAFSGSLGYSFGMVSGINASGFHLMGEEVLRQALPIGSLTMSPTDSLVFPQQNVVYSSPRIVLHFPATNGSHWSGSYNFTTDFNLTVLAYSLNAEPGQRKTYISYTDSVIGWGTVKVKDYNGNTSGSMNVLMVKHIENQIDSFYLSGMPAPLQLLSAFGLTQGQTNEVNEISFYRAGEIMPLVNVSYFDNSFAQSQISDVEVHMNRLASTASISNVTKYGKVSLYPNPATGNQAHISIGDNSVKSLRYDVINIQGQVVAKGTTAFNTGSGLVQLGDAHTAGIYFVRLYDAEGLVATLPVSLQ